MAKKKAIKATETKTTEPTLKEIQQQVGDLLNKIADSEDDARERVVTELFDHRIFDSMKESDEEDDDESEYDDENDDLEDDDESEDDEDLGSDDDDE